MLSSYENVSNKYLQRIVKGSTIILLGIFISKFFGYLYRIIVARLGSEQYGILSLALAITGFITVFSLFGLPDGLVKFISQYRARDEQEKIKAIFRSGLKIVLLLSITLALLLFLFSNFISIKIFNEPRLALILKMLAIAILFNSLRDILLSAVIAFQKIKYSVYSKNIIENVSKVAFSIILIFLGYDLVGAAFAYLIAIIISLISALYFVNKNVFPISEILQRHLKKDNVATELFLYSWPLLFSSLFVSILAWTDTFMIGIFKTSSDVGIYNTAVPTALLLFVIPSALTTIFFPIITELHTQRKFEEFISIYKTTTKWIFIFNIFLAISFIIYSKEILTFIFGSEYGQASLSLIVLSVGYFLFFLARTSEKILLVFNKTKLVFINYLFSVIANIIMNLLLIPIYGILGAAIATSISHILIAVLEWIESAFISRGNPFTIKYLNITIAITLIFLFMVYVSKKFLVLNLFHLLLVIFLSFMVYILLIIATKALDKDDIYILRYIKLKVKEAISLKQAK